MLQYYGIRMGSDSQIKFIVNCNTLPSEKISVVLESGQFSDGMK